MKKNRLSVILLAAAILLLATQVRAADVVQGKCVAYDIDQHKVVIEEYDTNFGPKAPYGNPTGIIFEGDIKDAKIGIQPEPGDILRIAYVVDADKKRVLKIMNVSKQDLRKK